MRRTTGARTTRADLERSLAIRAKIFGADNPIVFVNLAHLGKLARARNDPAAALAADARAVAIAEKAFGDANPQVGEMLHHYGDDLLALGRAGEAAAAFERELATIAGADGAAAGRARFGLARALWALGRERERAVELGRAARDAYAAAAGTEPQVGEVDAWLKERRL